MFLFICLYLLVFVVVVLSLKKKRYSVEIPILKGDGIEVMERCEFRPRIKQQQQKILADAGDEGKDDDDKNDDDNTSPVLSRIIAIQAPLPLGIILGQDITVGNIGGGGGGGGLITTVDDLAVDGNGSVIGGIQVGDIVRGCTACQSTMEQPTWQLILGGVGQPKTTRMMFSCDNQPLEEILTAISSNTMDPQQRYVWLVLERIENNIE